MFLKLFIFISLFIGTTCFAEIITDRPDFTEGSTSVPKGAFQVETGFTISNFKQDLAIQGIESLFRVGVTDELELRFGMPNSGIQFVNDNPKFGAGDYYLGVKYQVGPLGNDYGFSIIPAVSIPSNDDYFSSNSVDPEIKFCWSKDLNSDFGLSGMYQGVWASYNEDRTLNSINTLSLDYTLNESNHVFLEYLGSFASLDHPEQIIHTGMELIVNKQTQFDIHGGLSFKNDETSPFVGVGFSILFLDKI